LLLLRGHEATVMRLVADFAGVVRGRQMRNAREVHHALLGLASETGVSMELPTTPGNIPMSQSYRH
jgi:hypothetical protein